MRKTFINSLVDLAQNDRDICLVTGDLGYGVVDKFKENFPDRFFNFGINEQSMMSAAAGMSYAGLKPYVYSIANFNTFRCIEQIRNDVNFMELDVSIVSIGAGFAYGTAGYSHHLIEDISMISALSNVRIFSPADSEETKKVLSEMTAINGPKYLRLGKGGEENILNKDSFNEIYGNKGLDLVFLFTGAIGSNVVKAESALSDLKIAHYSIYDLSFDNISKILLNIGAARIITVEEHVLRGGFGSIVLEVINKLNLCNKVLCLGIKRLNHMGSGDQDFLRTLYNLDADSIANAARDFMKRE